MIVPLIGHSQEGVGLPASLFIGFPRMHLLRMVLLVLGSHTDVGCPPFARADGQQQGSFYIPFPHFQEIAAQRVFSKVAVLIALVAVVVVNCRIVSAHRGRKARLAAQGRGVAGDSRPHMCFLRHVFVVVVVWCVGCSVPQAVHTTFQGSLYVAVVIVGCHLELGSLPSEVVAIFQVG